MKTWVMSCLYSSKLRSHIISRQSLSMAIPPVDWSGFTFGTILGTLVQAARAISVFLVPLDPTLELAIAVSFEPCIFVWNQARKCVHKSSIPSLLICHIQVTNHRPLRVEGPALSPLSDPAGHHPEGLLKSLAGFQAENPVLNLLAHPI